MPEVENHCDLESVKRSAGVHLLFLCFCVGFYPFEVTDIFFCGQLIFKPLSRKNGVSQKHNILNISKFVLCFSNCLITD